MKYKFFSKYAPDGITKFFNSDDEALDYAEGSTDSGSSISVFKLIDGNWAYWDIPTEKWVSNER